jgi:hypothetical protein
MAYSKIEICIIRHTRQERPAQRRHSDPHPRPYDGYRLGGKGRLVGMGRLEVRQQPVRPNRYEETTWSVKEDDESLEGEGGFEMAEEASEEARLALALVLGMARFEVASGLGSSVAILEVGVEGVEMLLGVRHIRHEQVCLKPTAWPWIMLTGKPNLISDDKLSASASGGKSSYVTFLRTLPRLTVGVKKV